MPHRVLFVVAPERFRDEELLEPRRALEAAGHRVAVASTRPGTARGMLGARVLTDATVRGAAWGAGGAGGAGGTAYDALALVGGAGAPAHLWASEPLLALVRAVHASGKPLAAICLATPVLARAGVLWGRHATAYPTARSLLELKRGGAVFVEQPVVVDGTIVTASGPEAAPAFGAALVQLLGP